MIHPIQANNYCELIQALACYLQAYFPNLDVWYVKTYTPDNSSIAAQIPVQSNSGHLGIGKKPLGAARAESVLMKVYNLGSNDWIFFLDHPRLQDAGQNIGYSRSHHFGKGNLESLQNFFDQNKNIIQSIQQIQWALLHKCLTGRNSPDPGRSHATATVSGVPSCVKRLSNATRTCNSAT